MLKMEYELIKQNWINGRNDNINIIIQSKYQIEIAKEAIELCNKKIRYFEKLEELKAKKHPKKAEVPKSKDLKPPMCK